MKENITLDEKIDGTTSAPMDWAKVIFLQIDRINRAMTEQQGNFMAGIDALEMDLAYYQDPQFDKDIKEIEDQAKKYLKTNTNYTGGADTDKRMTLAYARAREKMKALLRLIGRKGFYPEQQGHFKGRS